MCGRYALALRPSEVRRQLEAAHMPVNEAPDDDNGQIRQSYNFAPGYHGLVYRADGSEFGKSAEHDGKENHEHQDVQHGDSADVNTKNKDENTISPSDGNIGTKYKLQAMKWGLIPFWTKRSPDYGSMMKTINCRDDSLAEDRGMWTPMKKKKRCIIVAQGFYEWLKKNGGKEKIPHFTKRKDGHLMCFAGLWDYVQYEDTGEKIYTYTIITTDSNKQLSFLHDRMPVILENGSEALRTWLDPNLTTWTPELQSLLKPYEGELECYPVTKDVGKVGNNSPSFIIPIDSKENKNNIANFFGTQKKAAKTKRDQKAVEKTEAEVEDANDAVGVKVEHDDNENRATTDQVEGTEDNAPLPVPASLPSAGAAPEQKQGVKREHSDEGDTTEQGSPAQKRRTAAAQTSKSPSKSPVKKKTRSATSNNNGAKRSPAKGDGSRKITSFFGK